MSSHKTKVLRLPNLLTTGKLLPESEMHLVVIKAMVNPVPLHLQMEEFACIHLQVVE